MQWFATATVLYIRKWLWGIVIIGATRFITALVAAQAVLVKRVHHRLQLQLECSLQNPTPLNRT